MPPDDLDSKPFTLNPSYLKAVRNEAEFRRKEPDETRPELSTPGQSLKAVIASKQAELALLSREIDSLMRIKDVERPVRSIAAHTELNQLRLKRVAIQMALVSGSDEYDDDDLLALDKQIAELSRLSASDREPDSAQGARASQLNDKIDRLLSERNALTEELKKLVDSHNLELATKKAAEYVRALKLANRLRHELLALAALMPERGPLRNLNLGGELPRPLGFEPFAALLPDELTITALGVEQAKARIRPELAFYEESS